MKGIQNHWNSIDRNFQHNQDSTWEIVSLVLKKVCIYSKYVMQGVAVFDQGNEVLH